MWFHRGLHHYAHFFLEQESVRTHGCPGMDVCGPACTPLSLSLLFVWYFTVYKVFHVRDPIKSPMKPCDLCRVLSFPFF